MNRWREWLVAGVVAIVGCAQPAPHEAVDPLQGYDVERIKAGEVNDPGTIYTQMGLVSSGPPLSFVARPAFFATATSDTTLVVFSLSMPNRGLTFQRNGAIFEAVYDVTLGLKRDTVSIRRTVVRDTVRVATLKETQRTDESVVFRQALRVPSGVYLISYDVRDATSGREMTREQATTVPHFVSGSLVAPVVIYEAAPRQKLTDVPQYLPAPRASFVFGVNTSVPLYIEAYGTQMTTPLSMSLRSASGAVIWHDTVWIAQRNGFAAGVVNIPLTSADVGVFLIACSESGYPNGHPSDTTYTSIFVGFGSGLPVMSFDDMLTYLRFFASGEKLHALQTASVVERGKAWRDFLRATDTLPETSQNEALLDYFRRIREANGLFRFDMNQGWLSDRGMVYVGLGQPDNAYEREGYWTGVGGLPSGTARTRFLIWEYRDLDARIIFYDETGGGQWRLVPSSASNFRALLPRRLIK